MIIDICPATTPEQAIAMAYVFAQSLRKTGWLPSDADFALSLWVEREYLDCPLLPYLAAGFTAGYHGEDKPAITKFDGGVGPRFASAQPSVVRDKA